MKKLILLIVTLLSACGGDGTGPVTGLTGGYGIIRLPDDPVWLLSWPSTSTESGCAQIQGDVLTFSSPSTFTEDRTYIPAGPPPVVTLTRYTGTYSLLEQSNQIVLHVDGATDTATIGTYQGNPALVAVRRFPDYTTCGSTGPYTMLYVNSQSLPD